MIGNDLAGANERYPVTEKKTNHHSLDNRMIYLFLRAPSDQEAGAGSSSLVVFLVINIG
jgi:hypothetical protein